MLTLEFIRTWWPIFVFSLNGIFVLIIWACINTFAKKEDVEKLKRDHESLKKEVSNLPSHHDVSDLKLSIEQLRGEVREIRSTLNELNRTLGLLLENELAKEK